MTKGNVRKNLVRRDLELLKFCFDQYFLTRKQIKFWFELNYNCGHPGSAGTLSKRTIAFLLRCDFIAIHPINHKVIDHFFITENGIALLKSHGFLPEFAEFEPIDDHKLNHDQKVTDVRLVCKKMIRNITRWKSERFIKITSSSHIPDAEFKYISPEGKEKFVAVEIELTRKSGVRYKQKFFHYSSNLTPYDSICYFTKNAALKKTILDLSKRTHKVFVVLLDDFINNNEESVFYSRESTLKSKELFRN